MEKPKVSLVILNHNRKNDLKELLENLRRQSYSDFETIVLDNNSQDGSPADIEKDFPEVRLIKLPRNIGVEGYNIGMINARGKFLIRLDSDALPVNEDLIAKIVSKFQVNPNLAILVCKIIDYETNKEVWDNPAHTESGNLELGYDALTFNGSGCAIRKNVLQEVGYFPAEFFVYYEELDFSVRVIDRGLDVKYFPDITVYHKGNSPLNENRFYYVTRNVLWFYWKYLPFGKALERTANTISYSLFWAAKRGYLRTFFKALYSAAMGFPGAIKMRKVLAPSTLQMIENLSGQPTLWEALKKLRQGSPL